jgi:hypothetical protein
MTFGELKEALGDLMARTDYTDAKRAQHINRAIRRIQRVAKLPMMERSHFVATDDRSGIDIPDDLIALKHFFIAETGCHLEKIDLNRIRQVEDRITAGQECPRYFYRVSDRYITLPKRPFEDIVLIYYAAWDPLQFDGDFNEITVKAPEAILYCAASYACTYFMDSRVQEMEQRFQAMAEDLKVEQWNEEIATSSAQTIEPTTLPEAYPGGW